MTFSEKLKQAMQELHLNQRQVCGMTGKSKGSVSQYLSGKQIPSEDVQSAIAVALGLESDYFSKSDEQVVVLPTAELRNGVIPRLDVEKAATVSHLFSTKQGQWVVTIRKQIRLCILHCPSEKGLVIFGNNQRNVYTESVRTDHVSTITYW